MNSIWNELINNDTALVVLPTGSGKSVIFRSFCDKVIEAKPDISILVLFNKVKLLKDQAKSFSKSGVYCATEKSWDLSQQITVASIKSLKPDSKVFDLIISDECHNVDDENGYYARFFAIQKEMNPKVKIVGMTATPYRYDGVIYGPKRLFKRICYTKPMRYFIDKGFLVAPIAKQPDFQIDISKLRIQQGEYRQDDIDAQTMNKEMAKDQVRDALNRSHGRNKIVWFCSSINHSELIKDILNEMGEKSVSVHSKMTWDEREFAHNVFENQDGRHLTFISVISEGYDYAPIDCIVLMRPTRSITVLMQTIGRGLRPFGSKEDCLVLDYGQAVATLGPIENPTIIPKGKGKGKMEMRMKACPSCRTLVAPRSMTCPECGFNWPKQEAVKLGLNADEDINFFEKKLTKTEIHSIHMNVHMSKGGNKCIRINYSPTVYFGQVISEYFAIDTTFGLRRFMARATELNIQLRETIEEQVTETPKKMPKYVEHFLEGKYQRIKRLVF